MKARATANCTSTPLIVFLLFLAYFMLLIYSFRFRPWPDVHAACILSFYFVSLVICCTRRVQARHLFARKHRRRDVLKAEDTAGLELQCRRHQRSMHMWAAKSTSFQLPSLPPSNGHLAVSFNIATLNKSTCRSREITKATPSLHHESKTHLRQPPTDGSTYPRLERVTIAPNRIADDGNLPGYFST